MVFVLIKMLSNSFSNLFGIGKTKGKGERIGKGDGKRKYKETHRDADGVVTDGAEYGKDTNRKQFNNKLGDRSPQIAYKGVNLRGRELQPKPKTTVKLDVCTGAVKITGKCKDIVLEGCYDITLTFTEATEGVTLKDCENIALTGLCTKFKARNTPDANIKIPNGAETATKDAPINLQYFKSTGSVQLNALPLQEVKDKADVTLSYADGSWKVVQKDAHPRLGSNRLKSWRDSWAAFLGGTMRGSFRA